MGFIKAFGGAIGGTFADQWKDFFQPMQGVGATVAIYPAVKSETNAGRGSNTKGSDNIITNGSKILVPEGTGLITMQEGAITGLITEPGGFILDNNDPNAKSIFSGDGVVDSIFKQTWDRFKYGGQPGAAQQAFYVNLKEIPGNRFGTQAEIYWDDAYLGAQVGAITRGTYSLKILDPILFIKQFVPADILSSGQVFDFDDMDNRACEQLFTEVVSSLSAAFSYYTNDPSKGNRITRIQGDQVGFAQSLSAAVEDGYRWKSDRGLEIVKVALAAIEYDEDTKALLSDVKKADALSGNRGNSFMQQSVARGFQAAGENPDGGAMGMGFMGMGMNAVGGSVAGLQQQPNQGQYQQQPMQGQYQQQPMQGQYQQQPMQGQYQQQPMQGQYQQQPMQGQYQQQPMQGQYQQQPMQGQPMDQGQMQQQAPAEDPYAKLASMKQLLDQGIISQEEFDEAKKKVLGL